MPAISRSSARLWTSAGTLSSSSSRSRLLVVVQHEDLTGDFQTLGLEDELLELLFVAVDGDGDAADGGIVGGRNRQAVDVEAAAAEQAGNPGQNAALVVHQHADDAALFGIGVS